MKTVITPSSYGNSSIVIGTPGFMSSEQSCGRPTFSSDLYSLGLTAIYLLTGKFPQDFNTDLNTGEILWQYEVPSLSPSFVGVLHKAIQSHYRDRYQSAKEMRLALEKGTTPILINPNPMITVPQQTEISQATYQDTSTSVSLKDWQKSALTASIIGSFMLVAIVLSAFLLKSQIQPSPVSTTSSNTTPTTENPTVNPTPQNPPTTTNPTPQNSSTTINPTPQNTDNRDSIITQNTTSMNKPSPEETVLAYYGAINSGNYRQAWNMLPYDLQENKKIHPDGYYSFENWFQTITPINIISSKVIAESSDTAKVNLHYSSLLNGKPLSMTLRYQLVWSQSQQQWLIQSVTKIN